MKSRASTPRRPGGILSLALVSLTALALTVPRVAGAAPTTGITIKKLASDGSTVLAQETVDYRWLMDPDNIPVLGDGATHYYHQGPVFTDHPDKATEELLRWNPEEDANIETKDMGALKGTNVKDLCELVGGMAAGDTLKIRASDGFSRTFAYRNVYQYSDREGPMVICWYKNGQSPDSGFNDGMRLVWFADASTNPWKMHVFGNWDWHEAAEEDYWYYFQSGREKYPTTTGLSIQSVSELIINSSQPAPNAPVEPVAEFIADITTGSVPLTVRFTDRSVNSPVAWAWDFDNDGKTDSSAQNPSHTYDEPGTYSVRLIVSNAAGSDEEVKMRYITAGPAPVTQVPSKAPVEGLPATTPPASDETTRPVDGRPDPSRRAFPSAIAIVAGVIMLAGIAVYLGTPRRR